MARYEAERQARLDARKKAREAESEGFTSSASTSTSATSESSGASSLSRSNSSVTTKKAIEENLEEWEADRKERLAERELDAQERKAALETQAAMEEAERKKKLEERRKQRELDRLKEEAEEAARKERLEERKREREAKRLAEEKEYEDKAAARRKAREERSSMISGTETPPASPALSSASSASTPASSASSTLHIPRNESPSGRTESPVRRKRLGEIGRASDSNRPASETPVKMEAPVAMTSQQRSSASTGSTSSSPTPIIAVSASPIPASVRATPGSLASSTDSISEEIRKEEEDRAKDAEEERKRKAKEEEETALLKAAADAEIKAQAEADALIREEMRREEEALLKKEKAAEEAAKVVAEPTPVAKPTSSAKPAGTDSPTTAAKSSAAAKMRSLLSVAREQQQAKLTGSKVHRFSTTERPIGHVPAPVTHRLTTMELFCVGGGGGAKRLPDPDLLMNHFVREGRLARDCVTELLLQIRTAFLYEKNVVTVDGPSNVIGDIHGQFYDLLHLFRTTGLPGAGENHFVFLGDYVDRGTFSCEVCLILFACKLRWPTKVTLLRGNHETRAMSSYHNFQKEATHKYGASVYEMFMEVFDHLPLAAIVETGGALGRVFCCHGGLGPSFKTIDEIQALDRFSEPEDDGALCDLIWADPVSDDKFFNQNFSRNKERGCSVVFGYNPIYDFLEFNNLAFIVRAHQVEEKGYKELHFSQAPPGRVHPMVITLFSAPNYCDSYENMAAYLLIGREEYNFHQYTWQQHPYCLPDFSNAIKFSLPFVAENIMKFLVGIVETVQSTDLEGDDLSDEEEAAADADAEASMERKLRSVGKSFIVLRKMRESSMGRLGNIIEQQKIQQQQQTSLVSGETQSRIDAARSRGGRRKVQRVVSDLSDIVKMAADHFLQAKAADADNERFHGRAAWKSTFRKLGRGVSFKI